MSRSRRHLHLSAHLGERAADAVAVQVGSWRFIIGQSVVLALWIVVNIVGIYGLRWDPMPFILLNLCLSFQAAFTAPIIMMSQNRQASINQKRDDVEASEVESLFAINREQVETLRRQDEMLAAIHALQQTVADHLAAQAQTTPVARLPTDHQKHPPGG